MPKPKKKATSKPMVAPRISSGAADFYRDTFKNLNAGSLYVLQAFPLLYRKTIQEVQVELEQSELDLIVAAFEEVEDLAANLAGHQLVHQVANGIDLNQLDEKYAVNREEILDKLETLPLFTRAVLEIMAMEAWGKRN